MAEPVIVQLMADFRTLLQDGEKAAVEDMVRRWLKLEEALEDQIRVVVESLDEKRQAGEDITEAMLFRLDRFESLLAQVQAQIRRFNEFAAGRIEELSQAAAGQGLENGTNLIGATLEELGQDRNIALSFTRLNVEAAENLAAVARAGQPLQKLLEAAYPLASDAMIEKMLNGVALGINPREITRQVLREGLAQGLNHVLLVTRDLNNRSYREANRQQFQRSGVIYGYRRLAAKQPGRTCMACIALDGTIYQTNELMAVHPQDRCAMLPLIRGFAELPIVGGEAYFRTLDEAVQRDWMGPERFDLWQRGRFPFRRLAKIVENDVWGPSAQVRPVKELLQVG